MNTFNSQQGHISQERPQEDNKKQSIVMGDEVYKESAGDKNKWPGQKMGRLHGGTMQFLIVILLAPWAVMVLLSCHKYDRRR